MSYTQFLLTSILRMLRLIFTTVLSYICVFFLVRIWLVLTHLTRARHGVIIVTSHYILHVHASTTVAVTTTIVVKIFRWYLL